jgi:hypothetical protein
VTELVRIGWWEWALLPGISNTPMKAKCDTGASLSALHAEDLELTAHGSLKVARFRLAADAEPVELGIVATRLIRSSNGESQMRPVVLCPLQIAGQVIAIECTLTDRTPMAYPMLLGRSALAGRFVVDPAAGALFRKPRGRRVAR